MMRKLYLSPLGFIISIAMNFISLVRKPFMVYGFFNKLDGRFYKKTRIASTCILENKNKMDIKDNVWIGHYCLIDGIGGVVIQEGVHVASHACIYTHSSQDAIRILGKNYIEIEASERPGYKIDAVEIGEYTFIGTSAVILAGTKIGKGCIIGAGSVLSGYFPDYSLITGTPAKVVGDTRKIDQKIYHTGTDFSNYYNTSLVEGFQNTDFSKD